MTAIARRPSMSVRNPASGPVGSPSADQGSTHRYRSANPVEAREVGTLRFGVGSSISLEAELHRSRLAQRAPPFADSPGDRSVINAIPAGPTARSIMGAVKATTGWDRVP